MSTKSYFGMRPYAMKLHQATGLHFDLRLEVNDVLLSFAIPADLSLCAGVDYEATEMEDHRLANIHFEGLHQTGIIMLWDRGGWKPHIGFEDVVGSLRKGLLRFVLYGERLEGIWTLLKTKRTQGTRPVWILRKDADAFATDIVEGSAITRWPNSVDTGRRLDEISEDWTNPRKKREKKPNLFDQETESDLTHKK